MDFCVDVRGQSVKGQAEIIQNQLWIHFRGKTYIVESGLLGKRGSYRASTSGSSDVVKSPMPGKITKIFVAKDDHVVKGQPVVIMEAMKMEYTLKTEISGQISSIEIKVGDQVPLGKILIKLSPGN